MGRKNELKRLLGQDYEEFIAWKAAKWEGPFTIDSLLDNCLDDPHPSPPESNAVYLVSRKPWETRPGPDCIPLYVGSNTGKSPRFVARIGDLIADMFGFFHHSSGGQSLHSYCKKERLNPKRLYLGWVHCGCMRCAENYLYDDLKPELNLVRPQRCRDHYGKEKYSAAFKT